MKFPALSRSLKRGPKDRAQKQAVVKALFEDAIPVTPRKSKLLSAWSNMYLPKPKVKGRKAFFSDKTMDKLDSFLSRNDISFTFPDRNHQVYVGKDGHTKNLLVFYKQKMMRSYRPLHFQLCTIM